MTKRKYKVLFASFEVAPFCKTGGLGEVAGSLPSALKNEGADVRVILPKLPTMPQKLASKLVHVADFSVPVGWRMQYCGVEMLKYKYMTYYFIDNEYYFKRDQFYGYDDDAERIAFFSKAILESLQHIPEYAPSAKNENNLPDIIHCNDWHTALVPVFLREQYREAPGYDKIKTVFSVHNLKFQGVFDPNVLGDVLGLAGNPAAAGQLIVDGAVNYVHGALCYSDRLLTVSPTYAEEICTPEFGEGMDDVFRRRREVLHGILNGIDRNLYNPAHDEFLPDDFDKDNLAGKARCKLFVQQQLGLPENEKTPLAVIVSRLTEQKGLDLLLHILEELLQQDIQVAVLGVGDRKYEDSFRWFAWNHPDKFACSLTFNDGQAHCFYAGADLLIMPSRFEPCGLAQMIAMRYGTLPVVRETGGLKDSVQPYNRFTGEGNGFSFANYNAHELLFCLKNALAVYHGEPDVWRKLQAQAFDADFSWERSAKKYAEIYKELLGR